MKANVLDVRVQWVWPAAIFCFSLPVLLALMNAGPYSVDCLTLAGQVQTTMATGRLQSLIGFGYPLTVILGVFFAGVTGAQSIEQLVWAMNLMSSMMGALGVAAFFLLAREMFDDGVAGIGAVLLLVSPVFLGICSYGNSQAPGFFFLVLGGWLLVKAGRSGKGKGLWPAAVCLGLGGAARLQDWVLLIPAMSFMLGVMEWKAHGAWGLLVKRMLMFWVVSSSIVVLFHMPLWWQPQEWYGRQLHWFVGEGLFRNFRGFFSGSLFTALGFLRENSMISGLVCALLGAAILSWKQRAAGVFLCLWFLGPFLFYGNLYSLLSSRFLVLALPPLVIGQAYLLAHCVRRKNIAFKAAFSVLAVAAAVPFVDNYPALKFRHQYAVLPDFVRWVEKITGPESVIISADDTTFYYYYTHRKTIKRPCDMNPIAPEQISVFQDELDALLSRGVEVYISDAGLYSYDADSRFSNFIKKNYRGRTVGTHFYESWHLGTQKFKMVPCDLYRLSLPEPS